MEHPSINSSKLRPFYLFLPNTSEQTVSLTILNELRISSVPFSISLRFVILRRNWKIMPFINLHLYQTTPHRPPIHYWEFSFVACQFRWESNSPMRFLWVEWHHRNVAPTIVEGKSHTDASSLMSRQQTIHRFRIGYCLRSASFTGCEIILLPRGTPFLCLWRYLYNLLSYLLLFFPFSAE